MANTRTAPRDEVETNAADPSAAVCSIRTASEEFPLTAGSDFGRKALMWTHYIRSRRRWAGSESFANEMRRQACDQLKGMGLPDAALESIAQADIVEVRIPFTTEGDGWETRILPWEALLTAATGDRRGDRNLLVVRHLDTDSGTAQRSQPSSALFVESAPDLLADEVDSFDSARKVVLAHLEPRKHEVAQTPTEDELRDSVVAVQPDVIHVSGVDYELGARLLEEKKDPYHDGYYLRGADGSAVVVQEKALAKTLNAASRSPQLVAFNVHNSAGRLAALAVAEGADVAIGLQNDMDDTLAELFFAAFYRAWKVSRYDTLQAFHLAWAEVSDQPWPVRRGGVVLWSRSSLIKDSTYIPRRGRGVSTPADPVREHLQEEQRAELQVPKTGEIRDILSVEPRPHPNLNYSLLHNDGALFRSFNLRKLGHGVLRDVQVEVVVQIGSDSFPYRASFDLDKPVQDISSAVRVPLTWEFMRTLRESVRTCLYVNVTHEGTVVHRNTYPVVLLPAEEWRDNKRDGIWFPTFVLPRDPAVARLVDDAQTNLMALADDQGAGFSGYQCYDEDKEDPWEGVDIQVRALWATLAFGLDIGYINPTPVYTGESQRLRSPTEIVDGRMGTCIDLALLVAACLEYVEIYPVIFLVKGHAFPGYWRSGDAWDSFKDKYLFDTSRTNRQSQLQAWIVERDHREEIEAFVNKGDLVPLESTKMAEHYGFKGAREEGQLNLDDRGEFALIDIFLARYAGVTPLPLRAAD